MPPLNVTVMVQVYSMNGVDRLEVREEAAVDAANFLEIAKILERFHGLVEALKTDLQAKR